MELLLINYGLPALICLIIYFMGKRIGRLEGREEGPTYIQDQVTIESLREDRNKFMAQTDYLLESNRRLLDAVNRHYEIHRRPGEPRIEELREHNRFGGF